MSYLQMLKADKPSVPMPEPEKPALCQSCQDLLAEGIRVLLCGTCGYKSPIPSRQISTEDREAFRRQVAAGRGRSVDHCWLDREVNSPRGQGRLLWTDGFRAGIVRPGEEEVLWLVDLADVELSK